MNIRQEQPSDHDTVYQIVKLAFESAEHRDENEQDLVVALRNSKAFVPELSLVALCDGHVVGHILFTEVKAGEKNRTRTCSTISFASISTSRYRSIINDRGT